MDRLVNAADRTVALCHSRESILSPRPHRSWRLPVVLAFYLVVLGLLAVPIMSVLVPPLADYPNHLARMHILAAYAGSSALQANYVAAWELSPYLAIDLTISERVA